MSNSETTDEKPTGRNTAPRVEREYHDVPATWMWAGRNDPERPGFTRFHAYRVCHQYAVDAERASPTEANITETDSLYVLYRNPDTDEYVERHYTAAVLETNAESVEVSILVRDEDGQVEPGRTHPVDYPVLEHPNGGAVVLPRTVYKGEPRNFRATITASPDETRVEPGV